MPVYRGARTDEGCVVTVDGKPLNPRLDLYNHSPTGFSWGFGGSGPAQLALAILADCLGDKEALKLYQSFKWQVVTQMEDKWILDSAFIENWEGFGEQ